MTTIENAKPAVLALFIGIALALTGCPPVSAGSRTLAVAGGCFRCALTDCEKVAQASTLATGVIGG